MAEGGLELVDTSLRRPLLSPADQQQMASRVRVVTRSGSVTPAQAVSLVPTGFVVGWAPAQSLLMA